MLKCFRGEDVACRYGGDEFIVILLESSLTDTRQRAEELRHGYKNLKIERDAKPLQMPTLSIGVAAFPDHGSTPEELLQAGARRCTWLRSTARIRS
jgi:diguanylate cyclase (GGDEF)-like protein